MFNFFKNASSSKEENLDDQYQPHNNEYGKHIDIRSTGYIPAEYIWTEQKPLNNNANIDESHRFTHNKDPFHSHAEQPKRHFPSFTNLLYSPREKNAD